MSKRKMPRALAALATAAVLIAGCAGLPTSDTIAQGGPVLGQERQNLRVLPLGPDQGADTVQIVNGFLRANVGFQDDHDIARDYLTPATAQTWRPSSGVVIYEGNPSTSQVDQDTVEVTLEVSATLDVNGQLTEQPAGTQERHLFQMEQIDGQWRIASMPDDFGLFLSVNDFRRQYQLRSITYLSQVHQEFINDPRWFPTFEGQTTALARAQLQPVPEYLRGAVDSGFPDGIELAAAGVPVDPGTGLATVDLTTTETITEEEATWMWVQMARTLTTSGVSQVRLNRGGHLLSSPEVDDTLGHPSSLGYGSPSSPVRYALLRVFHTLEYVDASHYGLGTYEPAPEEELTELPAIEMRWVDLAAAPQVSELAAVSYDRTQISRWRGEDNYVHQGIGTNLTTPSYDRSEGLWVAGQRVSETDGASPRVWWIDTGPRMSASLAKTVRADWMEDGWRIEDFLVGPDDTKAVVHVVDGSDGSEQLLLTAIMRDDDGIPVSLTEPRQLAPTVHTITDVAWASATELSLLGQRNQDNAPTPLRLPLGDWIVQMTLVEQAVAIRAWQTPQGADVTVVRNSRGLIFSQEGLNRWESYRNGDDLVVPGH